MNLKKIEKGVGLMLEGIGIDTQTAKDMRDTPSRVAQMYAEVLSGYEKDGEKELEIILEQEHDEIILVKNIPICSLCEHHLLPFFGKAHVAYIPSEGRITGLSKIARVVDVYAKRLQVQERLTTLVADTIDKKLRPKGVMVVIEAEHMCMNIRGVKKQGSVTTTSVVRGVFRKDPKTRSEALSLIFRQG